MPLDCVTHCYLILRPLTSSQRGFISLVRPAYSPIALRSRWLRPANHGFTLQSELFKQVLCEAALITETRSRRSDVAQPRTSWAGHSTKIQTSIRRIHTGRMKVRVCVSKSHPAPVNMSDCYTCIHICATDTNKAAGRYWFIRICCPSARMNKCETQVFYAEKKQWWLKLLWKEFLISFSLCDLSWCWLSQKNESWQNGSGANVIPSSEKHCFNFVHSLWAKKMRWTASLCSSSEYAMKTKSMD